MEKLIHSLFGVLICSLVINACTSEEHLKRNPLKHSTKNQIKDDNQNHISSDSLEYVFNYLFAKGTSDSLYSITGDMDIEVACKSYPTWCLDYFPTLFERKEIDECSRIILACYLYADGRKEFLRQILSERHNQFDQYCLDFCIKQTLNPLLLEKGMPKFDSNAFNVLIWKL